MYVCTYMNGDCRRSSVGMVVVTSMVVVMSIQFAALTAANAALRSLSIAYTYTYTYIIEFL